MLWNLWTNRMTLSRKCDNLETWQSHQLRLFKCWSTKTLNSIFAIEYLNSFHLKPGSSQNLIVCATTPYTKYVGKLAHNTPSSILEMFALRYIIKISSLFALAAALNRTALVPRLSVRVRPTLRFLRF